MVAVGSHGEAAVEIQAKFGQIGIGAIDVGNTLQAQLLDQAILEGLIGAFDASFGLYSQIHLYRTMRGELFK